MLQFNAIVHTMVTRYTPRLLWRLNLSLSTNSVASISNYNEQKTEKNKTQCENNETNMEYNNIFNELKRKLCSSLHDKHLVINEIQKAQNINQLIQIMKSGSQYSISDRDVSNAYKIIMEWSLNVNAVNSESHTKIPMEPLNNFINDDISILSVPETIQKICELTRKHKRDVQLLNSYFQNIIDNHETLKMKSCSTLLFCMGSLSYSDERLLKTITASIISHKDTTLIKTYKSILKSMAIIRYRDTKCLEHICQKILDRKKHNPEDIVNILQSFAMLDYYSEYVQKLEDYISDDHFHNLTSENKINFGWFCTMFKTLNTSHAKLILDESFTSTLINENVKESITNKLKLLNINAYAKYALKHYSGPFLEDELGPRINTKSIQSYLKVLESSLKYILPSAYYFKMNVDTKMGFYLDAELGVDSNFNFINIHNIHGSEDFTRVAILIVDYHHTYLGQTRFVALIKLYSYLLECKNYVVLCLSYKYLSLEDKIEKNANYIHKKLLQKLNKNINKTEEKDIKLEKKNKTEEKKIKLEKKNKTEEKNIKLSINSEI